MKMRQNFSFAVLHRVLNVVFSHDVKRPDSVLNVSDRFLVHRYSVLQQHVEDNAADGMDDPLETNHTHNGKIEFHDDSDEVCGSIFLPRSRFFFCFVSGTNSVYL